MMFARRELLYLLAGVFSLACSGDAGGEDTGPEPGTLGVTFVSPNSDDGAVMVQVTGMIDSVVAVPPYRLLSARPSTEVTRVIVTGDLGDGLLFRVYVPDIAGTGSLGMEIMQVAQQGTYSQRSLAGYGLVVQP
jgi:hypothetical protein